MSAVLLFFCGWVLAELGCWFAFQYGERVGLPYLGTLVMTALGFSAMAFAACEFAK